MTEAEDLGFHPLIWLQSVFKRIVESHAGRGGVEAIGQFADQIATIPELMDLCWKIETNSLFFESAIAKCNEKMLKRPISLREGECFSMLGGVCENCGYETASVRAVFHIGSKCPKCGSRLKPLYFKILEYMMRREMEVTPEAILMYVAYDKLAEAYVAAYKAINLILSKTAEMFGWDHYRIEDPQLRNYLDSYYLGRLAGESKIPREEKQLLQFLSRGNMAGISVEEAERLIRLGMDVVKYGYIYQVLSIADAYPYYVEALMKYKRMYNAINSKIQSVLSEVYAEKEEARRRRVMIEKPKRGRYAPCFYMPRGSWVSGSISEEIELKPIYNLPIFPQYDMGSLQAVYGKLGSGKTFLLSSLACYAIRSRREVVFSPLNDRSNSLIYAGIPLFPYDKRTKDLHDILMEIIGVEPAAVPIITLNFLRPGEKIYDTVKHPPTVFDRIIEIDDPLSFRVDFKVLLEELKEVSETLGYGDLRGIICVRNLRRHDARAKTDVDVQVATNLIEQLDDWRKGHPKIPMRVVIDEVMHLAPSTVYSGEVLQSGRTIVDFIKESRRNNLSIDMASQMPLEILPNIRDEATNVFFRNLATSRDKSRSQIDYLLDSLMLKDPEIKEVIRDINNRGLLGPGYWFWYHQPSYSIEVIRPSPPTFCLHDKNRPAREVFRLYEKHSGMKVLLDSWDQVERLEAESRGKKRKRRDARDLI